MACAGYRQHMPTQHQDTIVSALADGETVDGLYIRSEAAPRNGDRSVYVVLAFIVDEQYDEKVWASPALRIPAVLVESIDDLDLAVNHVRRVAALRCADLIRTTRAIRGAS